MADDLIDERVSREGKPDPKKVRSRARAMRRRGGDEADDPTRSAEALLAESEERTDIDPAPRDLKEKRVERRRTDETTPPPDQP
jgi:hypothetical protein